MDEKSEFFTEELTEKERELYDRQFRLEGWSQSIIKNSRVLIAGIGGLGCEIAKNLTMVGVGHLDLVDLDIIEHSNLNRQILFVGAKMGEPKAKAAVETLRKMNPNIEIDGYHCSLERLDPILYKKADLIIGGLDSMNARLNLNAQCVRFGKPLVDGGVAGYHGHFYTVFPHDNACYECNPLPIAEMNEMAACTVVGIPRKRVHCVFKASMAFTEQHKQEPNPKNVEHVKFLKQYANELVKKHDFYPLFTNDEIVKIIDRHDPGIITINAVISAMQSHEAVKILHWMRGNTSLGVPVKTYLIYNAMTQKLYAVEKKRNPNCRQCGNSVKRVDVSLSQKDPCSKIIEILLEQGYRVDPDLEPTLTIMDFNDITEIDLEKDSIQNGLRDLELITAAGFDKGEIFINLHLS